MELIKERRNASNLTRYYRISTALDTDSIIRLLSDIRLVKGVKVSYILLSDLMDRSEEGADSLRLSGDADIEELQREIRHRNIDVISMNGTFEDKPVVIGVRLHGCEVFVTIRLGDKADIDALEKELSL